jgi:hypothetical protein
VWSDGPFTEQGNVLNGPYTGFTTSDTTSTAPAGFLDPPADLHLTASSPAVGRSGASSPFGYDLDHNPVPRGGNCGPGPHADAGAYEFPAPHC